MDLLKTKKMKIVYDRAFGFESLSLCFGEECDASLLQECEQECFPLDAWSEKMFAENLKNPSCRVYILYDKQLTKIIGFGVIYICIDEADLANIAVLPEFRRGGLGRALLNKMMTDARAMGVLRTFLEVRESNSPARGLYSSYGFAEIGARRNYYKNPRENAVLMVLDNETAPNEK